MSKEIELVGLGIACHDCAVLIVNGDDSHMDAESVDACLATIGAMTRDEGVRVVVGDSPVEDGPSLFRCCCCGDDCAGIPWPLVGVRESVAA